MNSDQGHEPTTGVSLEAAIAGEPGSQAGSAGIEQGSRRGKGFLAVCGAFVGPGVGHLIVGKWRAAAVWFVVLGLLQIAGLAVLVSERHVEWLFILLPLTVVITVAYFVHAFIAGRRSRFSLGPVWVRYVGGIALLVIASQVRLNIRLAQIISRDWAHAYINSGRSMEPTLLAGDYFILNKRVSPQRWSPVVFRPPCEESVVVKRLVGFPGERVEIVDGELTINGQVVPRPAGVSPYEQGHYLGSEDSALRGRVGAGCEGNPLTLGPDEYYVLGDYSMLSRDSRYLECAAEGHPLGAIPAERLEPGRVTAIYWPPGRWRAVGP